MRRHCRDGVNVLMDCYKQQGEVGMKVFLWEGCVHKIMKWMWLYTIILSFCEWILFKSSSLNCLKIYVHWIFEINYKLEEGKLWRIINTGRTIKCNKKPLYKFVFKICKVKRRIFDCWRTLFPWTEKTINAWKYFTISKHILNSDYVKARNMNNKYQTLTCN